MKIKPKTVFFLAAAGLLFSLSRLVNLTLLPVFADEAIYIHWSQIIWHDATQRFIPLSDGKPPLFMWLMVPFLKFIKDPLLAGRLLSAGAGLAVLIGLYLLAKKLFNDQVSRLALVLALFSPFLLFYDRLALADSLLTALGVWSFWLSYLLFEKPKKDRAIFLGTIWGLSLLTKPTGAYFILLTPFFILLCPRKKWGEKIKKLIVPGGLASIYSLSIYNILRLSSGFHMISRRSKDYLRTPEEIFSQFFDYFGRTCGIMLGWLNSWLTWPMMVFLLISLLIALTKKEKKILLLFFWALMPFLVQAAIGKIIYPRYFLFIAPFLLLIIGWGLFQLGKLWRPNLAWGLLLLLLIKPLTFDYYLLFKPEKAPLHQAEKEQYLQEWSAGYGIRETADFLKKEAKKGKIVVGTEGYFGTLPDGLLIYVGGEENIQVFGMAQPLKDLDSRLRKFSQDYPTYLLVNNTRLQFEDPALELIRSFPKPPGPKGQESLLFFRVKGK